MAGEDTTDATDGTAADDYSDVSLTDQEREALAQPDDDNSDVTGAGDGTAGAGDTDTGGDKPGDSDDTAGDADKKGDVAAETDGDNANKEAGNDEPTPTGAEEVETDVPNSEGKVDDQQASDQSQDQGATEAAQAAAQSANDERQAQQDAHNQKLADIETSRAELKKKFEDGELDTVEYMDQRDVLSKEESDLVWQSRKEEMRQESARDADTRDWDIASREFSAANPDYFKSPGLTAALQTHTNAVFADPRYAQASHSARLAEAKRRTDEDLGLNKEPAPKADNTPTDAEKKAAEEKKKAAMAGRGKAADNVDPTLSDVPAADKTTAGSADKFAHLDDMEGVELERAIAGMSEAEQDAWRASSH